MGVHNACRHFYWAPEAVVGIALVVSHILNIIFAHLGRIDHYRVVHWQCGGCRWIVVCNHEEIEDLVVVETHNLVVDDRAAADVNDVAIRFFKKSG